MKTQNEITGKTVKQLVSEGILKQVDFYSNKRAEFEDIIRMTDGYNKVYNILTSKTLSGSEKQVIWAEKLRAKKAEALAFEIVAMNVSNEFGGDYNVNAMFSEKSKIFATTSASIWIDNRF